MCMPELSYKRLTKAQLDVHQNPVPRETWGRISSTVPHCSLMAMFSRPKGLHLSHFNGTLGFIEPWSQGKVGKTCIKAPSTAPDCISVMMSHFRNGRYRQPVESSPFERRKPLTFFSEDELRVKEKRAYICEKKGQVQIELSLPFVHSFSS